MADRLWRGEAAEVTPGVRRHGYRITCAQCPNEEFITFGTHSGLMSPEGVEKKFRSRKWLIGKKDGEDLCPVCAAAQKAAKRKTTSPQQETPTMKPANGTVKDSTPAFDKMLADSKLVPATFESARDKPIPVAAKRQTLTLAAKPDPKPMSREDRRVIFAKLDEVYLDEERGYRTGWHDQKVAVDLGVPVEWVKAIREENFGPAGNDEWRKLLEEAKAIPARHAEVAREVGELSEKFKALDAERTTLSAKVTKLALDVERIQRGIETIERAMK